MPSGKEAAPGIARLLKVGVDESASLEAAAELSRLLDAESVAEIEAQIRAAFTSGDLDAADRMLVQRRDSLSRKSA